MRGGKGGERGILGLFFFVFFFVSSLKMFRGSWFYEEMEGVVKRQRERESVVR